jgi:hypothetical protein
VPAGDLEITNQEALRRKSTGRGLVNGLAGVQTSYPNAIREYLDVNVAGKKSLKRPEEHGVT